MIAKTISDGFREKLAGTKPATAEKPESEAALTEAKKKPPKKPATAENETK